MRVLIPPSSEVQNAYGNQHCELLGIAEGEDLGRRAACKLRRGVSMQIRQLEEQVGLPLFTRTPRRVIMTEAGEYLLERARRIMREHDSALAEIAEVAGAEHGRLRIGSASAMFATRQLPGILQKLKAKFPNAEISVTSGTSQALVEKIMHGEVDIAFVSLPVESTNVTIDPLFSDEIVAIAHPKHPLAKDNSSAPRPSPAST